MPLKPLVCVNLLPGTASVVHYIVPLIISNGILSASLTMGCCIMSRPNNSRANPGNSQNDWYTGWSCIKTLICKALVVKWSNPAK